MLCVLVSFQLLYDPSIATILLSLWDFVTFILSMIFFALAVMNLGVIVFHPAFHRRELTIFDDPTVSYSSGDNV